MMHFPVRWLRWMQLRPIHGQQYPRISFDPPCLGDWLLSLKHLNSESHQRYCRSLGSRVIVRGHSSQYASGGGGSREWRFVRARFFFVGQSSNGGSRGLFGSDASRRSVGFSDDLSAKSLETFLESYTIRRRISGYERATLRYNLFEALQAIRKVQNLTNVASELGSDVAGLSTSVLANGEST